MILPLALALLSAQATTLSIPYKPVRGEVATYALTATLPFRVGTAEYASDVTVRTLSVARNGGAKFRISDENATLTANGEKEPMKTPPPYEIEVDRRGFIKKEPQTTSPSALMLAMFGIPERPATLGEEFEWKMGGYLRNPRERVAARLVEVRDGVASYVVRASEDEKQIYLAAPFYDVTNGRLVRGDFTGDVDDRHIVGSLKLVQVVRASGG